MLMENHIFSQICICYVKQIKKKRIKKNELCFIHSIFFALLQYLKKKSRDFPQTSEWM